MDEQVFRELGFTNAETRIYLALLKLGPSTAGPILKKTGLQNSVVHMALAKMVEKGIVSFILVGKIKHYSCTNPKNLHLLIEEKESELKRLNQKITNALPELLLMQKKEENQQAEIFKGFRGLKNMLYSIIEDAKKGDEYLFFAYFTPTPQHHKKMFNFYKEFETVRHQRGIIVKGIAPKNAKKYFAGRKTENILFTDLLIPANITIFKDYVAIEPAWKDDIVVFLMKSKELAQGFKRYWHQIYDSQKK